MLQRLLSNNSHVGMARSSLLHSKIHFGYLRTRFSHRPFFLEVFISFDYQVGTTELNRMRAKVLAAEPPPSSMRGRSLAGKSC